MEHGERGPRGRQVERCDLCILGAGIAGLNALFAATRYLGPDAKVVLVDARPAAGGMWTDTYDYVRLHQPHPFFTAGNLPWTLTAPPEHLASKDEVLAHFRHCIDELGKQVNLVERYGFLYESHREVPVDGHHEVEIVCRSVAADGASLEIHATRCVKAFGFCIPENPPLALESNAVHSVSPHDQRLIGGAIAGDDKPIYVVGGGKTAMDSAHMLITRFPGREVNLIVGRGTRFTCRDRAFPSGLSRWWRGVPTLAVFLDLALRFDGDNEREVYDYWRRKYSIGLDERFENFFLGLLSEAENAVIADGVHEVVRDYLEDVVDDEDGAPRVVLRRGEDRAVEPGSWFVNCTGYVLRQQHEYEPFLSEHGALVSVQPSSSVHILTTFAAYFLVHLWYLDKLATVPLYELDQEHLIRENHLGFAFICIVQLVYNTLLIAETCPRAVMRDCGLDFDRWFPLPRRLPAMLRIARHGDAYRAQLRRALDRVRERHAVRCGPLPRTSGAA